MNTILSSLLKIVEYFMGWLYNKSTDKSISKNENAKKMYQRRDENIKIIKDAQYDEDKLEELRKRASE